MFGDLKKKSEKSDKKTTLKLRGEGRLGMVKDYTLTFFSEPFLKA